MLWFAGGLVALAGLGGCMSLAGSDRSAPASDAGVDALEDTPSADTPAARLADALAVIYADSPYAGELRYAATLTDLNNDAQPDAIAYVQGPNGCDEGCDLFIFQARDARLVAINRLPLARPPLTRSDVQDNDTGGWVGLATQVAGPGAGADAVQRLRFAGGAYQPAEVSKPGPTRTLIADMLDTKRVPAPPPGD